MASLENMVLSFGEVQEKHRCITIAYAGVRIESKKLYSEVVPTEAIKQAIIYLQEQAKELNANGVKNIDIKTVVTHNDKGEEVVDFLAQGTIIELL